MISLPLLLYFIQVSQELGSRVERRARISLFLELNISFYHQRELNVRYIGHCSGGRPLFVQPRTTNYGRATIFSFLISPIAGSLSFVPQAFDRYHCEFLHKS
jgi:hypothetical protein